MSSFRLTKCSCGWPSHPEIPWYKNASPDSFEPKAPWASCDEVDQVLTALKYRTSVCGAEVTYEMCEQLWCDGQLDKKRFRINT